MGETLPADLALEGALPRVHSPMHHQLGPLRKRASALGARVGLLLAVRPHMLPQMPLEVLQANGAPKRLYVLMKIPRVLHQGVPPAKPLPAQLAHEHLHVKVRVFVQAQVLRAREPRRTHIATVGLLPIMYPQMLNPLAPSGKAFAAKLAGVGLLPRVRALMES